MSENMQTCPSCNDLVPIEYVVCVWCGFDLTAEHIRRAGIKIGRREAINRMIGIVRQPMQTSKELALIPDQVGGKLVLYFLGIVITLNMLVVFNKLDGTIFNQNDSGYLVGTSSFTFTITYKFIVGVSFLIVQPIVLYIIFRFMWKLGSRVILLLTRSIGGTGDQTKIRTAIGYSLVPVLLGWIFSLLFLMFASKANVAPANSYSDISDGVYEVTRTGIGIVSYIFIIIGWLWAVVLSVIIMRQMAKLSVIESIIAAGIPTTIMMTIVLFGTDFLV